MGIYQRSRNTKTSDLSKREFKAHLAIAGHFTANLKRHRGGNPPGSTYIAMKRARGAVPDLTPDEFIAAMDAYIDVVGGDWKDPEREVDRKWNAMKPDKRMSHARWAAAMGR